jgi:deoxyribonuclease V
MEALSILEETIPRVAIHANTPDPKLIAAVETDYSRDGDILYCAASVLTFPDHQVVERSLFFSHVTFPYYADLIFFREGFTMISALAKLHSDPDLLMVSGHGIAHPQLCGVASHIGIAFDKPTVGCARRLLDGQHRDVDEMKGSAQPILLRGQEVGVAYRSKDGVKPIFISPAHRCDLEFARRLTVQCLREYRLPEPLRIAHLEANKYRQRSEEKGRQRPPSSHDHNPEHN